MTCGFVEAAEPPNRLLASMMSDLLLLTPALLDVPARQLSSLVASTVSCCTGMMSACVREHNHAVLLNGVLELLLPLGCQAGP